MRDHDTNTQTYIIFKNKSSSSDLFVRPATKFIVNILAWTDKKKCCSRIIRGNQFVVLIRPTSPLFVLTHLADIADKHYTVYAEKRIYIDMLYYIVILTCILTDGHSY